MIKQQIQIINKLGLHARASTKVVELANRFKCDIYLEKASRVANAKSIMSVMMLAASKGSMLWLTVDGIDEDEALISLTNLVAHKFGESE